jgi:hypothetical protein
MESNMQKGVRGISSQVLEPTDTSGPAADMTFATNLGFNPVEVVDLPEPQSDLPPIAKAPTPISRFEEDKAEEKRDIAAIMKNFPAPDPTKVITNVTDDIAPPKFYISRVGKFPYHEECEDEVNPLSDESQRLDNVSGVLPYLGQKPFEKGIYITEPTIPVGAAISSAVSAQSLTALIDALSKTVNVPYRRLTTADHLQIMYFHLINSYPAQRMPVSWDSGLYGVTSHNKAYEFKITETLFTMDPEQWKYYSDLGFTLPRVYDLENVETVSTITDGLYYLEIAQFIDPYHPSIQPFVLKAAADKSPYPRLQGRLDFLATKKIRFKAEVDKFRDAIGKFGVTEQLPLTADVSNITIGNALAFLQSRNNLSPEQVAEFERLLALAQLTDEEAKIVARFDDLSERFDSLSDEEVAERSALEQALPKPFGRKFTPVEEGVPLVRDLWRFFSFV